MSLPGDGGRPAPRAARDRWLDALARAGWSARPADPGGAPAAADADADDSDSERVAVGEALGRVTAAPVTARWPSPRADCAAMDGIAVRAGDLPPFSAGTAPADGEGADGDPRRHAIRLPAGTFEWIDTGDPMPEGTDTVVLREWLLPQADGSVLVTAAEDRTGGSPRSSSIVRGQNVRTAGEDFAAGEVLVPAGRRLRPGDLAAAAAGGHVTVTVARRPVVAIIPTGDEIRPVGSALGRGDIAETNSLMLTARCRQLGALPSVSAVVPDDPDALAAELRRVAAEADLVLVIAGSSRGRGDHAGAVLAQVGGVAVAGVAVRPGHPAILGLVKRGAADRGSRTAGPAGLAGAGALDGAGALHGAGALDGAEAGGAAAPPDRRGVVPAIGLPGYPLATAVIFELFAIPLLAALQGCAPAANRIRARLDRDWISPAAVEDWVLVTLGPDPDPDDADAPGLPLATPARRGASSISQLARADAWWVVPAGRGEFGAGTDIEVWPIPRGD